MPKRRAARRAPARRTGRKLTGKIVLVALALCLTASGLTWAEWGHIGARPAAAPYAIGPPAPPAPVSFSPGSPAKEYVYAGGRLVATEEPAAGTPPAAPTNLQRYKPDTGHLVWTDNSSDETGFSVEAQASAGGAWSQVGTVGAGVKVYLTGGTNCETRYPRFRVRAFNAHGSSAPSNEATPSLCYLESTILYDAVQDLSATQNPSGAWSYGSRAAGGGSFILFTNNNNVYGLPSGMHTWYAPNAYNLPGVIHNGTGATQSYFGATQPTMLLNLYPGAYGERSVVRWTARAAGTAQVAGRFEGLDATTTAVSVVKNGSVSLFNGSVNGLGNQAPFSLSLTVAAGDTIEFQVACNGDVQHDSTGLAVTVTTQGTPAPLNFDAVNDFSPTQSQGAAWAYGSRPAGGGSFAALPNNDNLYGLAAGMHTWYLPGVWNLPAVFHNGTGATQSYFGATQPIDLLNLYPGGAGERSVVRWTAPRAGTAQVTGRFQGLDATTTAVAVVKNGATTLASGSVNGLGNQAPFSLTVAVAAGDTLEFQVSYNGDVQHDSTGLAAAITLQ